MLLLVVGSCSAKYGTDQTFRNNVEVFASVCNFKSRLRLNIDVSSVALNVLNS